jgi:hypothetical protein
MTMSNSTWKIPSNNGHSNIQFHASVFHETINVIEYRVELAGEFLYRIGPKTDPYTYGDINEDFHIVLPSVLIPTAACQELLAHLNAWMAAFEEFTCELTSRNDQSVVIGFSRGDRLVKSLDKPTCTFYYKAPSLRIDVCYTVDQSCVRIARNGLELSLESFEGMFG